MALAVILILNFIVTFCHDNEKTRDGLAVRSLPPNLEVGESILRGKYAYFLFFFFY